MTTRKYAWIATLFISVVLLNCAQNVTDPVIENKLWIFGVLAGDEKVDSQRAISLSVVETVDEQFTGNQAAITGAIVSVTDQSSGTAYSLSDSVEAGSYFNENLLVMPNTTYRLDVDLGEDKLSAVTTVPPALNLNITTDLEDSTTVVFDDNLSIKRPIIITNMSGDQGILFNMFCNETFSNAEYIEPPTTTSNFPLSDAEYQQGGSNGEPRNLVAIGTLQDWVSETNSSQFIIDWYANWLIFYGSNTMTILALDNNYNVYVNSDNPGSDGLVEGGLGLFGSITSKKYHLQVEKP